MATAAKLLREFAGTESEVITVWIRDARLIAEVYGINSSDLVKIMTASFKESALSWATQILTGRTDNISLDELIDLLSKRFGSNKTGEITLSRFLISKTPNTREEFPNLLRDGIYIQKKKLMSSQALAQMIFGKHLLK